VITNNKSYTKAFVLALVFHVIIAFLLLFESQNTRPALTEEVKNETGETLVEDSARKVEPEIVKAVSVDKKELMQTVSRLKQERANQIKAEQSRQANLAKEAEKARKERIMEQKRIAQLKDEADKIAIKRKKEIEEEQKRLEQLAEQKEKEAKRIEDLKKEQEALEKKKKQESEKLAALKKKEAEQAAKEEKVKAENAKKEAEKAKALALENKLRAETERRAAAEAAEAADAEREAAAQRAANQAQQRAKMAGEVDKYKALILNAIGQRWILPEHVESGLSSVFRIRLAPDGAVLDVSLSRSSGDPILDRSAQAAIFKASPLPVPNDPLIFDMFRDISLTVRPENVRG
jgi:colicin import membrane protein